jgi:hypothetical protein
MSQENLPVKQEAGGNGALTPSAAFNADSPGQAAPTAPKTRRPRKPRIVCEQEARLLLRDLSEGLDFHEICQKNGWSVRTYWRRLQMAEQTAREEYRLAHTVCLKHQTFWRHLQHAAGRQADDILLRIDHTPRDAEHALKRVALIDMFLRLLKFMGECDKHIFAMARQTGVMPPKEDIQKREAMQAAFAAIVKESARAGRDRSGVEGFVSCGGLVGALGMLPREEPKVTSDGKATNNENE